MDLGQGKQSEDARPRRAEETRPCLPERWSPDSLPRARCTSSLFPKRSVSGREEGQTLDHTTSKIIKTQHSGAEMVKFDAQYGKCAETYHKSFHLGGQISSGPADHSKR
jgi:hypothetical protein